jgi:putative intracellular protease/amidase/YHS domain-containing protein
VLPRAPANRFPANGSRRRRRVAFVLSPGAVMIDFAGPWEVFQNVSVPGRGKTAADTRPFQLFTVAESRQPIRASAGLQIVPDYSFSDAPQPKVIVVPAQGSSPAMLQWLRKASAQADITLSVCSGAFVLAEAGLLDGRAATTHHEALNQLARTFPKIDVRRDVRYVEGPRIATAAGLTSGIDLSLRVVERYFGREVAEKTALFMEHESDAWRARRGYWDASTGERSAARDTVVAPSPALRGLDPVLLTKGEEAKGLASLAIERGGYRYHFATEANRKTFESDPERYEIQLKGACAFMARNGAPPGSGDPDRYYVHDGRIYIFASENCRDSFKVAPSRYLSD